jgi:hypothetical protein
MSSNPRVPRLLEDAFAFVGVSAVHHGHVGVPGVASTFSTLISPIREHGVRAHGVGCWSGIQRVRVCEGAFDTPFFFFCFSSVTDANQNESCWTSFR